MIDYINTDGPSTMHIQFILTQNRPADLMNGLKELVNAFYAGEESKGFSITEQCLFTLMAESQAPE